ncbi:MAG: hypothetical protein U0354_06680 [Candidatus Sericytochromatia bacterium]
MNKLIIFSTILILSGCYLPQQSNMTKSVTNNTIKPEIKFTFSLKNSNEVSLIKSVNAYLVTDPKNPLNSIVAKYQSDVSNSRIFIGFSNYPTGGPYYLALQVFDDINSSINKKNITAINSSINSTDKQFDISLNSVNYSNNLIYSDGSNSLKVEINIINYNDLPLNVVPENGSKTPTKNIELG